ncbi:MAG: uracil-DNA glycosylase family 4 [bacterium]|jgi:uracil-DNA glycosylase family 4
MEHSSEQDLELLDECLHTLEGQLRLMSNESSWINLDSINQEFTDLIQDLFSDASSDKVTEESFVTQNLKKINFENQTNKEKVQSKQIQTLEVPQTKPLTERKFEDSKNLDTLRVRIHECTRCGLASNRKNIVFGQGNHQADLLLIGEAPGEDEDMQGLPFIGKAGKLLTQIIQSIGVQRKSVYICNVVKCRPPKNRNPHVDETAACLPILKKQIELINPKLIVTLGNVPTKTLIPKAAGITKMRGQILDYEGYPLIPTFHPAYLLRNLSGLPLVWDDMRKIRQFLFQKK